MSATVSSARYGQMKYGGSKYALILFHLGILTPDVVEDSLAITTTISEDVGIVLSCSNVLPMTTILAEDLKR